MHVCSVSFRETECSHSQKTPGATPFYENTTAKGVKPLSVTIYKTNTRGVIYVLCYPIPRRWHWPKDGGLLLHVNEHGGRIQVQFSQLNSSLQPLPRECGLGSTLMVGVIPRGIATLPPHRVLDFAMTVINNHLVM